MKLSRRILLRLFARVGLILGFGSFATNAVARTDPDAALGRLAAFLDTLIPDDDMGPGAVRLGVDRKFLAAAKNRRIRKLMVTGFAWLDEQAKHAGAENFAALGAAERHRIVAQAEASARGSLPYRFFRVSRNVAFFHYYAHPQAWAALGYDGPPQPGGFLDYAEPPKRRS